MIALSILYYVALINTVGILFAIYGYGSAKGWWK
jgi:hypothetical protein